MADPMAPEQEGRSAVETESGVAPEASVPGAGEGAKDLDVPTTVPDTPTAKGAEGEGRVCDAGTSQPEPVPVGVTEPEAKRAAQPDTSAKAPTTTKDIVLEEETLVFPVPQVGVVIYS
ncbi:hypothetical protein KIPB_014322 [Kipferlia bialata]|uniref:Uncharacterized protein n=1 Tax=Kipferlia bialata TaxID=797122 RepID=A0A391NZR9_9EUKA|nr:hypothetical protein KIPB_014322 [Kipferlia bialata]|eukprot:g14322.t1